MTPQTHRQATRILVRAPGARTHLVCAPTARNRKKKHSYSACPEPEARIRKKHCCNAWAVYPGTVRVPLKCHVSFKVHALLNTVYSCASLFMHYWTISFVFLVRAMVARTRVWPPGAQTRTRVTCRWARVVIFYFNFQRGLDLLFRDQTESYKPKTRSFHLLK